jgi:hypothetical protein
MKLISTIRLTSKNKERKEEHPMNKTKRVAWHKHLAKARKATDKRKAQKSSGTPATAARR